MDSGKWAALIVLLIMAVSLVGITVKLYRIDRCYPRRSFGISLWQYPMMLTLALLAIVVIVVLSE